MCEAGVNIKVIQDTLGHADVSTTLNIYADATRDMKKNSFAGFENYLKARGGGRTLNQLKPNLNQFWFKPLDITRFQRCLRG